MEKWPNSDHIYYNKTMASTPEFVDNIVCHNSNIGPNDTRHFSRSNLFPLTSNVDNVCNCLITIDELFLCNDLSILSGKQKIYGESLSGKIFVILFPGHTCYPASLILGPVTIKFKPNLSF